MKHVVSFLVVAVTLLQVTVAAPVDERSDKKFACTSHMSALNMCIPTNEIYIMV